jgi:hypothetical protein
VDLSPFDFTGPLPPDRVRGRDGLLEDLTRRITARSPTALLGPRRFGKTSVLQRLGADLTEVTTVAVDLMPVQSVNDAIRALVVALLDTNPAVADAATATSARIGFNLLALRGDMRATRSADRPDANTAFSNLVDTLVQTGLRRPTLITFDEFQQIAAIPNGTSVLRSALQHHYKDIGLVFAGSAPSAMRDIFSNPKQPFLHQADIVEIGPLSLTATVDLVDDGFAETGRAAGGVAATIHAFTHGHPLRTMQAAHLTWQLAEDRSGSDAWGDALPAIRKNQGTAVAALYEQLPTTHKKALRILANRGSVYGRDAAFLDLAKSSAQDAVASLAADGHLVADDGGRFHVTDPFLADWLRITHPL